MEKFTTKMERPRNCQRHGKIQEWPKKPRERRDRKNMKKQRNLQSVFGKQQIFGDQNNGKSPEIEIKQRQSKSKIEMERSKN